MPKKIKYEIVKRKIKYPRLEFKTGKLVAVVPHDGNFDVPEFVNKHQNWIRNKQDLIKRYSQVKIKLRKEKLDREDLRVTIEELVDKYETLMKVRANRIVIKQMKSKWGSCSSSKNLCFNSLLAQLPNRMIEYVVYHEMCHLKHRKHDTNFQLLLKRQYSKPEILESKLFSYWFMINKTSN